MHVLFVCTGNTCRSPMAEAITRAAARARGIDLVASSAGTHAETVITPNAAEELRRRGIDPGERPAVQVTPAMIRAADLVLCATARHRAGLLALLDEPERPRVHVWGRLVRVARTHAPDSDLATVRAALDRLRGEPESDTDDLPDPAGRDQDVYAATADRIEKLAAGLLDVLRPRP